MGNKIDNHVGARMRRRRKELGVTQEGLGEALGVTFQQIQKYERGANRMGASRLYVCAITLGVTPNYFFQGLESFLGLDGTHPDAALLDIGQREEPLFAAWYDAIGGKSGPDADAALEAVSACWREAATIPARTMDGLRVKAAFVAHIHGEDDLSTAGLAGGFFDEDDQKCTNIQLMLGIVSDLLPLKQ